MSEIYFEYYYKNELSLFIPKFKFFVKHKKYFLSDKTWKLFFFDFKFKSNSIIEKNNTKSILNGIIIPEEKRFEPTSVKSIKYGTFNIINIGGDIINITNDIFAMFPLFYYNDEDIFIISSKTKPIVDRLNSLHKKLTRNISAEFLAVTFGYLFSDMTFFNEIKYLSPASNISIKNNKLKLKEYYKYNLTKIKNFDLIKDDFFCELDSEFQEIIKYFYNDSLAIGLSGGLDSRLIYSYLSKNSIKIMPINWAFKETSEYKLAKEVAYLTNNKLFLNLNFNINMLIPTFKSYYNITEGYSDFTNSYLMIVGNIQKKNNINYMYNGFLGDAIFGGTYLPKVNKRTPKGLFNYLFLDSNLKNMSVKQLSKCLCSFDEYEIKKIFPQFKNISLNSLIYNELMRIKQKYNIKSTVELNYIFLLLNRGFRYINYGVLSHRAYSEVLYPFFAYPVFMNIMKIPYSEICDYNAYNSFYKKYHSEFAKINNHAWGVNCYASIKRRKLTTLYTSFKNICTNKLSKFLNKPIAIKQNYVDYDYWFLTSNKFRKFLYSDNSYGISRKHLKFLNDYYGGNK